MAYDKYYSKEEITKRLRLKLQPKPTLMVDRLRKAAEEITNRGGNGRKERLLPFGR